MGGAVMESIVQVVCPLPYLDIYYNPKMAERSMVTKTPQLVCCYQPGQKGGYEESYL